MFTLVNHARSQRGGGGGGGGYQAEPIQCLAIIGPLAKRHRHARETPLQSTLIPVLNIATF